MNPQRSVWQTLIVPFLIGVFMACGYFVFKNNPEIMDQESYFKTLANTKTSSEVEKKIFNSSFKSDVFDVVQEKSLGFMDHRLQEVSNNIYKPITLTSTGADWITIAELIVVKEKKVLTVTGINGETKWTFSLSNNEIFSPGDISHIGYAVFVSTLAGRIFAFDSRDGELIWYNNTARKLFLSPKISQENLVAFVEEKTGQLWSLLILNSKNGQHLKKFGSFDLPFSGQPIIKNQILFYAAQLGRLNAINISDGKLEWTSEGSSVFLSGPAYIDDRIYVTNEDNIAVSFDPKTGKKLSEIELGTAVYEPLSKGDFADAFTVDTDGHLLALDLREAKRKWRYQLNINSQFRPLSLAKLSKSSAAKLNFISAKSNWTVWTTCSTSRLCIFDADNGRLLHRIDLKGNPVGQFRLYSNPSRLIVPIEKSSNIALTVFEQALPPATANITTSTSPSTAGTVDK